MIPENQRSTINDRLCNEVGFRDDVGKFVFHFAFLPEGHDLDYALEELKKSTDDDYKKAIQIVLEGII